MYSEFEALEGAEWNQDEDLQFEIEGLDSTQSYNLFINIRNDETFPYSNLFLITELESPDGNTLKDTLEYRMAEPSGEWLGKGYGSIKESKLWFKENVNFLNNGVYKISISHAMRKNGTVEGVQQLKGITDVGLEIEKSTQ